MGAESEERRVVRPRQGVVHVGSGQRLAVFVIDHVLQEALTDALAKWTATLWSVKPQESGQPPRAMYVDGHKKPVYTAIT